MTRGGMLLLGRRLVGLIVLLAVVAGVPALLAGIGGNPIPSALPAWHEIRAALSSPDDGSLFLGLLLYVAWAAWATFAFSVLVEVAARVWRHPVPRLPALRMQQRAAATLVGLVMAVGPQVAAATAASAAPAAPAVAHSQMVTPPGGAAIQADITPAFPGARAAATDPAAGQPQTRTHVVRTGETLWSIAERELGDGARFPEIAELNYGRQQPDGHTLERAHWIHPGWELQIPITAGPAHGSGYTVRAGDTLSQIAQDRLGDASRYPEIAQASHLTDPDVIDVGWPLTIPGQTAPTPAAAAPAHGTPKPPAAAVQPAIPQPPPPAKVRPQQPPPPIQPGRSQPAAQPTKPVEHPAAAIRPSDSFIDEAPSVRTVAGVGALLAAGVIGLITVRRRAQQRRRRPGHRLPMPAGEAAAVEQELRATADPLSVTTVDLALRTLAADCAQTGQPLPVVRAGRLTADQFDLYLAEPAHLPAPWQGTADNTVWTLDADLDGLLDQTAAQDVPAPYPSLVTIGHDPDDGHVFLDLEYLGALGLTGDPEQTRQVLAAIAVELATSQWADDLQVTIVGAHPELGDALQTGRIRYLPSAGHILDELTARARQDRTVLADAGAADLNHARAGRTAAGAWTPEIVLLPGELTGRQRRLLVDLVDQLPRVAVAAVTGGEAVGEWSLRLDGSDEAVLEPIGLRIRPQRIDDRTYRHVLDVMAVADTDDETSGPATVEPRLADLPDLPDGGGDRYGPAAEQAPPAPPAGAAEEPTPDGPVLPEAERSAEDPLDTGDTPPVQAEQSDQDDEQPTPAVEAGLHPLPLQAPRILVLGPVELIGARGVVEPTKAARLTELAAFLTLNPGSAAGAIDAAYSPHKPLTDNGRVGALSRLRRWLDADTGGDTYLPRHPERGRYRLSPQVSTDWADWCRLLPNGPEAAATETLEAALRLVRGQPFEGAKARYYAWAEPLKQEMITATVDAAYELARRRLLEGRWRAAEEAAAKGLRLEPGYEPLWRLRIMAAHYSGNPAAQQEAIDRLMVIADGLGGDLEDETEQLLEELRTNPTPRRDIAARAL